MAAVADAAALALGAADSDSDHSMGEGQDVGGVAAGGGEARVKIPKRLKHAMLVAYCGTGYQGFQLCVMAGAPEIDKTAEVTEVPHAAVEEVAGIKMCERLRASSRLRLSSRA